jgi:DNA-binding PadR family transcriptional regulator
VAVAAGLTDFEQVLLGMVCRSESSGYDLKRAFATTPLGVYQPSSGALYPALRRLERRGLLEPAPGPGRTGGRPRRILRATTAGRAEHARWLRQPVDPATVSRTLGVHLMRFVLMETELPRAEVQRFLRELEAALAAAVAGLEEYVAGAPFTQRHIALALDHGAAAHRASLAWVRRALAELSGPAAPDPPRGRVRRR